MQGIKHMTQNITKNIGKKKLWTLVSIGFLLVIGAGMSIDKIFFQKAQEAFSMPLTLVKVGSIQTRQIPLQVSALGEIKSVQEIDLAAQQSGYLTAVNVKNGEMAEKGQVLFQIDNKSALAGVLSAKAALDQAKLHFDRIQILVKQGAESQDVLDSDQKNLEQAEAALDQANKTLSETTVKAPFTGQVTYTDLAIGSYVNIGDKLIGIVNSQSQVVQYVLPASYLNLAELGQVVLFDNPLNKKEKITAKVIYISPEVDTQSESFVVRALIENPPASLKPGLTLMVTEVLNPSRKVFALPGLALMADPNGFYVFLINQGKKIANNSDSDSKTDVENSAKNNIKSHSVQVLTRRVKIGEQFDSWIEIRSGLVPSDLVVIEGQQKIHEGQWVQVTS